MGNNSKEDGRGGRTRTQVDTGNKSGNNTNGSSSVVEMKAAKQQWRGRGSCGKGGVPSMAQEVEGNLGNGDVGTIRHHMHLGLDRPIEGCTLIPRCVWRLYGETAGY